MKLLAVLITLFLYRTWQGENPLQRRVSFQAYQAWFLERHLPTHLRYLLCVGVPTLVVAFLAGGLAGELAGILWLALSLVVLVYSIEQLDAELVFNEQVLWLRSVTEQSEMAEIAQRQDDFEITLVYDLFQSVIPVVFWFLILGPAGALFYALTARYLDYLADDDPEVPMLDTILHWLEWLPARITTLIFTLVGNFGPSFDYWAGSVIDTEEANAEHLTRVASIAVDAPDDAVTDDVLGFARLAEDHVLELKELCSRAVYGWVGIAALVVILGW